MRKALTKCDTMSWCSTMEKFNATMTRESWVAGTYSHPWGTGAITGVAGGIMGIEQTLPSFGAFTVRPRIADMEHASIRVPTLRGYIHVDANQTHTMVKVPGNAVA